MKLIIDFLYPASILFSAVMAFIYRKGLLSRMLIILIPYLFLVFIQEVSVYFYLEQSPTSSTGIVYNIYKPITVLVFSTLYYLIPFNRLRKLIIGLVSIYLVANIITYGFIQTILILNSYLSLAGGFVITCCGIFFLLSYFSLDDNTEEKHWRPVIWITIGVITFYPVIGISYAFHKELLAYQATIFGLKLYHLIPQVMSIFMYGCFARAFYLCRKKK